MWANEIYLYSNKVLKTIAENYSSLYTDGLSFREGNRITDVSTIAEYLCDFDNALSSLGRKWVGLLGREFKDFRRYNKFQRIIISVILGVTDEELVRLHFYDIERLRSVSFSKMVCFLNGVDKSENKDYH